MDTRSSFSSICMLWISVCVGLHSGESVIPVSGEEGSTAVLPCELKSLAAEPHISWRTESGIVFERKGKNFVAADGYEDRVDVPEEELRKRNCSLVLRNLQLDDTNVYICSYIVRLYKRDISVHTEFKEISRVSLSVREKRTEEKSDEVFSPTEFEYYEVHLSENVHEARIVPSWLIFLLCVCSVSVLINIMCMCVCCCRKQDNCNIISDWNEKKVLLQDAADWTCVTYTSSS